MLVLLVIGLVLVPVVKEVLPVELLGAVVASRPVRSLKSGLVSVVGGSGGTTAVGVAIAEGPSGA